MTRWKVDTLIRQVPPDVAALPDVKALIGATLTLSAQVDTLTRTLDVERAVSRLRASTDSAALVAASVVIAGKDDEIRTLGAFGYSHNETVLHHDASLLPEATQAKSAWNYRMDACAPSGTATPVTYWMNRLQGLTDAPPFLVTLNGTDRLEPGSIVETMHYTHPLYTPGSVAAQSDLPALNRADTAFAGAYHGWGFHEDGCRSGYEAAERFAESGVTVFVMTYRLPQEGWSAGPAAPLQDAQRALRLIRAHAADYAVDPTRVGVIGFSMPPDSTHSPP